MQASLTHINLSYTIPWLPYKTNNFNKETRQRNRILGMDKCLR